MSFKDHFSGHAEQYARYRPTYPGPLFQWLADNCTHTTHAWDCATGNGQAAREIARLFDTVTATDASRRQIGAADPRPGIYYRVATAENSGLENASVDLVTVAQALHWFELDKFYAEVRRVARDGALLAAWYYFAGRIEGPVGDRIREFDRDQVGDYWPPEARVAQQGYANLPFPFARVATPDFEMRVEWTIDTLCGYLATWSATRRCAMVRGGDPIAPLRRRLEKIWPAGPAVVIRWPLDIVVGRV